MPIKTGTVYKILGGELLLAIIVCTGETITAIISPFEVFLATIQWTTTCSIFVTLIFIVTVNTLSYVRLLKKVKIRDEKKVL